VVFRLNQARPLFLTQMASFQCGSAAIIHKDSVNADGSWKAPIGTGPYKLGEWKRGEWIELTAFKDYKSAPGPRDGYVGEKKPIADTIRWIVVKDDASRRAALAKGQVDLMPGLRPTELTEMGSPPELEIRNAPTMSVNALLIQVKDPVLANAKLRQAISASLDTRAIASIASGASGTANASMVPSPSKLPRGSPQGAPHKLDPCGREEAPRGVGATRDRADQDGHQPSLSRHVRPVGDDAGDAEGGGHQRGARGARVGHGARALPERQVPADVVRLLSRVDPYLVYESMLGDKAKSPRKVWDNPKAIALLQKAGEEGEPPARQKIFDEMHAMMLEDVPLVGPLQPRRLQRRQQEARRVRLVVAEPRAALGREGRGPIGDWK
jgi:peptide/nickel transport system substrate-binding protein